MANEKRLIDANPFVRDLTAMKSMFDAISLDGMIKALKEAPTVDAVEVVRCVNCRSLNMTGYDEDNAQIIDPLLQSGFCEMWGKDTQLCKFCSYGERREGE